MTATLLTNRGGAVRIEKSQLMQIGAPNPTKSWRPIPHGVLVNSLGKVLSTKGLLVKKEEYAIQRAGNILFGIMDLAWGETAEFYAALGLRTSNDKSFALQIAIGLRVLVCDNLAFHGELIALRRKHTGNLDLMAELARGVERYMFGYQQFQQQAEALKSGVLTPVEARQQIYAAFAQHIIPVRLFHEVAVPYLHMTECPTQWDVLNSFTHAVKRLTPGVQFDATVRLGKFFSRPAMAHTTSESPLATV
jgi:hypothetical protein